jgi:hypothetical protein
MGVPRKVSLQKLEAVLEETDYSLRYAKGNFRSGFCIIKDQKQVVINAFAPKDAREGILMEIIRGLEIDESRLSTAALQTVKALKTTEE